MRINDVTESQQFKRWFGDWVNHPESIDQSLLDENGKPKVFLVNGQLMYEANGQYKSVDNLSTYDRFNFDPHFSERDTGKTDRQLLADAFDHTELSAKEKTLLDQYKQNIEKYNNIEKTLKAEQEKLRGRHST